MCPNIPLVSYVKCSSNKCRVVSFVLVNVHEHTFATRCSCSTNICIYRVGLKSAGGKSKQRQPAAKGSIITITAHGKFHTLTATQCYANCCCDVWLCPSADPPLTPPPLQTLANTASIQATGKSIVVVRATILIVQILIIMCVLVCNICGSSFIVDLS